MPDLEAENVAGKGLWLLVSPAAVSVRRHQCWGIGSLCLLLGCSLDGRDVTVRDPAQAGASGLAMPTTGVLCDASRGDKRCIDDSTSQRCQADGRWGEMSFCAGATPVCRADVDGDCGCVESQRRCVAGASELCVAGGWLGAPACQAPLGHCLPRLGSCVSCEPGTETCQEGTALVCSGDGQWQERPGCAGDQINCGGCTPGEPCTASEDCAVGICLSGAGTCGCDGNSCNDGQICSAQSGLCEQAGSDCPPIGPTVVGETDLAFVSVRFNQTGSAEVLIENVGAALVNFAAQGYQLCNGAENCIYLSDDAPVNLLLGDSFTRTLPSTVPSGGELAIIFESGPDLSAEAYVAWGTGGGQDSLEVRANAAVPFWVVGERITIAPEDTGFVCTGATNVPAGYSSCNP